MRKILDEIRSTQYDQRLLIDDANLEKNFFAFQETDDEINRFTHDDLINDWLIERVRRFNSSTLYLVDSITNAINLQEVAELNDGNHDAYALMARREIRNICINTEMFFDKMVTLCKYCFFFDPEKTKKNDRFIDTLKQFIPLSETISGFLSCCKKAYNSFDLQYVNSIRNDEIHNESPLDLHEYHFDDSRAVEGLFIVDNGFKISNKEILQRISVVISLMIETKDSLQKMLETIHPLDIESFVKNTILKNVVIPKNRIRLTKDYKM